MILSRIHRRLSNLLIKLRRPIYANISFADPDALYKGRTVLITGGTSGIGKAMAKAFHKAGATVIITSRSEQRAEEAALRISSERVIGARLEAADVENMKKAYEDIKTLANVSHIDVLVNNAGIIGGDIRWSSEEEFDRVIATNLKSAFFLSKLAAVDMIKNKVQGNILNIASSSSLRPAVSAYTLSKWGIRGLTEGLAKMFSPHNIVVNGLAPGPTATPMLGKDNNSNLNLSSIPLGRYILPEEIAAMALFLCGPMGRPIIGDIVYMTGGAGVIENNDYDYTFDP